MSLRSAPALFQSTAPLGIIQPHSVSEVPVTLAVQQREEQSVVAHFKIFGSPDSPLDVALECFGEGPVVHVTPHEIDFGHIEVLRRTPCTLTLSNESPIPAKFTAHMVKL